MWPEQLKCDYQLRIKASNIVKKRRLNVWLSSLDRNVYVRLSSLKPKYFRQSSLKPIEPCKFGYRASLEANRVRFIIDPFSCFLLWYNRHGFFLFLSLCMTRAYCHILWYSHQLIIHLLPLSATSWNAVSSCYVSLH